MCKRNLFFCLPFLTLFLSRMLLLPAVFQVSLRLSPLYAPFLLWSTSSAVVCWIFHKKYRPLCTQLKRLQGLSWWYAVSSPPFLTSFLVGLLAMAPKVEPHMPCSYAKFWIFNFWTILVGEVLLFFCHYFLVCHVLIEMQTVSMCR